MGWGETKSMAEVFRSRTVALFISAARKNTKLLYLEILFFRLGSAIVTPGIVEGSWFSLS